MTELEQATTTDVPLWHHLDTGAVLERLDTTEEQGLAELERMRRRARHGANTIGARKQEPWWEELAESFTEPLQLLLIAVAVLSAIFGELSDAIAIAVVILVVAVLETVTEMRASAAIAALSAMTAPTARLVTAHGVVEIPAADLVPGDVIAIEAGAVVPADARVLEARALRVDESSLTGEAQPVGKDDQPVAADTDLAERSSMLFAGSPVLAGEARAVVVATGVHSELGVLGRLVATTREPATALQRGMSELARAVLIVAIAASVLVPVVGLLAGQPWQQMLLAGLTVAFATVPEELPILITVLLAVGGRQLARQGALLRRLHAGETLGAVTTVVTDKTGTLTENRLHLDAITGDRRRILDTALHTQAIGHPSAEPIETEIATAAAELGLHHTGTPVAAFPFDPTRKLVSRVWDREGHWWVAVAGAPEAVLARCDLDPAARTAAERDLDECARHGLRVVAVAERIFDLPTPASAEEVEQHLHYTGLVAFSDPLREGVPAAVADLYQAGVATIVVTGDHPSTATAIATAAGLPATVLLGRDADALPDDELTVLLRHGTVIARATPTLKHRLVQLLQERGEVVAVTGDGANDAPALAAADVGIAMGHRGVDIARAAADLVLTDDAYPTVVTAIAKGRNLTAQLRRAVAFYLGAKLALVTVMLVALALGRPVAFQPIHIVVLEIFMDLGASVAFVAEPAAPDAMRQRPRATGGRFLDRATLTAIGTVAATLTLAVLPAYLLAADPDTGRTMAVATWLMAHVAIAWTLRTRPSLSWLANPAFPAWALAAALTATLVALTPVGGWIHLSGVDLAHFGYALALTVLGGATALGARAVFSLNHHLI